MKNLEKTERREYANRLLSDTVLGDWFSPVIKVMEKIRFSDRPYTALPMHAFILYGCFFVVMKNRSI